MSTVNGLPAHILLNHLVVVLGPLTALLAILCALVPAARRRLIWLVLLLAAITLAVTPLTINSGSWLAGKVGASPPLDHHAELGETVIYFVAALAATVLLLTAVHVRQMRGHTVKFVVHGLVGLLVVSAAAATLFQIFRVGESGARATWGNLASASLIRLPGPTQADG